MDNTFIQLEYSTGTQSFASIINFKFLAERYTPYTTLSATFIGDSSVSGIKSVRLYIKEQLVHCGLADSISCKHINGQNIISVFSRSFAVLLGQNEPIPGIISDINLSGLISYNTTIPNIECQSSTDTVNYIFVKESSTIWDAVCAYAYKAYKNHPYITYSNKINVTKPLNPPVHDYSYDSLIHYGESLYTSSMTSQIFMADSEGEYSYTLSNINTSGLNIVRKKYISLDRQWLTSPYDGLQCKLNFSNKGFKAAELKYAGYKFENIMDNAIYRSDKFTIEGEHISLIEVTGNKKGIFTRIAVYRDNYA